MTTKEFLNDVKITGDLTVSSVVDVTDNTTSTTTTTGALKVAGGVGIVENLNVGGTIVATGRITSNNSGVFKTVNQTSTGIDAFASHASYATSIAYLKATRADSTGYYFLRCDNGTAAFRVYIRGDGLINTVGSINAGGDLTVGGDLGVLTGDSTLIALLKLNNGNITFTTTVTKITTTSITSQYGIDTTWISASAGDVTIDYTGRYRIDVTVRFQTSGSTTPTTNTIMQLFYGGVAVMEFYGAQSTLSALCQHTISGSYLLNHTSTSNKLDFRLVKTGITQTVLLVPSGPQANVFITKL